MKLLLITTLLFLGSFLFGQNSSIHGRVVSNDHKTCISQTLIKLVNKEGTIIKNASSNVYGQFKFDGLSAGEYLITVKDTITGEYLKNNIKVEPFDTLNLTLLNHRNCELDKSIGICPNCGRNNDVILTFSDSNRIVNYQFKNRKSAKKYFKKKAKLGYETEWDYIRPDLLNKIQYLVWIASQEENKKFKDPCYHWFCKSCKLIF